MARAGPGWEPPLPTFTATPRCLNCRPEGSGAPEVQAPLKRDLSGLQKGQFLPRPPHRAHKGAPLWALEALQPPPGSNLPALPRGSPLPQ